MVRIFFLLIVFFEMGVAQTPIVKLVYEQRVTKISTNEIIENKVAGILHSFQPILLNAIEEESNMRKEIYIGNGNIYVENFLLGKEGIFSSKIFKKDKIIYLNNATGEEKILDNKNLLFTNGNLPKRFKSTTKKSNSSEPIKIYSAKNNDMLLEYQVDPQLKVKKTTVLPPEYHYKKQVIIKSKKRIFKDDRQIINELIAIDTLESDSYLAIINKKRKFHLENQSIKADSINYGEEIPDIYLNQIGADTIFSLNKYKENGKYLLIDFWGTWCKPCLASIPELKLFYEEYSDYVDLLALNYNDPNLARVKEKIKQYGMDWDHGSVSEKILKLLNPNSYFPGVLLFDDNMKLMVRGHSKAALQKTRTLLDSDKD